MGKRLLIFAIIFLSLLAFTIWRAQPPFRLQRKILAKLPYAPQRLLITDLDDDGHPEVTAFFWCWDKPPIWVRFPFDKPSRLRFENVSAYWMVDCPFVLKALPVFTADRRLRLLRWKDGKAILEPLPNLPDVPMEDAFIAQGAGTETVFLKVYRGENVWVFILSPQGEWKFASRATRLRITDLADFDRDGLLDALCLNFGYRDAWVCWGGKGEETDLGSWLVGSDDPRFTDLDGDGWKEIVAVAEDRRLKIWQFDQSQGRMRVIAISPPLPVRWGNFYLLDLDGDGREEIWMHDDMKGHFWMFQWREGRLKMWQGETGLKDAEVRDWRQVKFGNQKALCTHDSRLVWLFPPRIWLEGVWLQWQFQKYEGFTVFAILPRGKQALFPSHWRIQEAPFRLEFAGDMDGDGSDEVIGYDFRWRRWRLYRAEVTKAGELRWRDVLLGREESWAFAMLVDGERRGLVVGWIDGRLELLMMESRK
jgi:hypothetical protein